MTFDVNLFVSGSTLYVTGGPGARMVVNVPLTASLSVSGSSIVGPLTGSLTRLTTGETAFAGGGIVDVSTGSNDQVLISASAGVRPGYHGFCSGSLTWPSPDWADVGLVVTNLSSTLERRVFLTGSTTSSLHVTDAGEYFLRARFNSLGSGSYFGLRAQLSSSGGTLLQSFGFAAASVEGSGSQHPTELAGVMSLSANDVINLQYLTSTGSNQSASMTWEASDPVDGENMHTGEISMFSLGSVFS